MNDNEGFCDGFIEWAMKQPIPEGPVAPPERQATWGREEVRALVERLKFKNRDERL